MGLFRNTNICKEELEEGKVCAERLPLMTFHMLTNRNGHPVNADKKNTYIERYSWREYNQRNELHKLKLSHK